MEKRSTVLALCSVLAMAWGFGSASAATLQTERGTCAFECGPADEIVDPTSNESLFDDPIGSPSQPLFSSPSFGNPIGLPGASGLQTAPIPGKQLDETDRLFDTTPLRVVPSFGQ